MGQVEVLQVLRKKKKWMTAKEIAKYVETGSGSVNASLSKLFKYGEVIRREVKPENNWMYEWKAK